LPSHAASVPAAEGCPVLSALGGPARARHRLHAVHPTRPGQEAAATAFALALTVALAPRSSAPVLWVQTRAAHRESGRPYGAGLAAFGLAPERVVVVVVDHAVEALAAAEMGLEEPGLAGVIAELPPRLPADMLKPSKRLSLRTGARGVACLLLHATPAPVEGAIASRWQAAARPPDVASPHAAFMPDWTPALDVTLARNRFGPLGRWSVCWHPPDADGTAAETDLRSEPGSQPWGARHVACFRIVDRHRRNVTCAAAGPHPGNLHHRPAPAQPLAADAADRPARAPETARLVPRITTLRAPGLGSGAPA
jgi:protein ImuA